MFNVFNLHTTTQRYIPLLGALLVTIFYFSVPWIAAYIIHQPSIILKYASNDAAMITDVVQKSLFFPLGRWLSAIPRAILIFPYWLLIFLLWQQFYLRTRAFWKYAFGTFVVWIMLIYCFPNILLAFENDQPSTALGNRYVGGIKNAKRVPFEGKNYTTYSFLGYLVGRTFVQDKVRNTIIDAYTICEKTTPTTFFVLGETGLKHGGRFLPHRSHQSGLSVDFMVPLLQKGKNTENFLGYTIGNLWGYLWEFDKEGKLNNWTMDFEATACHILALEEAAKKNGLTIEKIIFDPDLQPELFATPTGAKIRHLPFTPNQAIWRHDEHFHIDFGK